MNPKNHALAEWSAALRVLVVEDDDVDAQRIAMVLDAYGYEIDAVRTAEEAILLDPGGYALVVCDVRLPGIDGATFANVVRRAEGTGAPPFLFVSSNPAELRTCDTCLEKPFSMRELVAAVVVALGMRASGVVATPNGRFAGAAAPSSSSDRRPDGSSRRGRGRR